MRKEMFYSIFLVLEKILTVDRNEFINYERVEIFKQAVDKSHEDKAYGTQEKNAITGQEWQKREVLISQIKNYLLASSHSGKLVATSRPIYRIHDASYESKNF